MRKLGIISLSIILSSLMFCSSALGSTEPIRLFVNGTQVLFNQLPIVNNGNTLVQLRPVFEGLGLKVSWDDQSQSITGETDKVKIVMQIDNNVATVNDKPVELAIAPRIVNGSTFVPLRFVGESSEGDVKWDEKTNHVDIITDKSYYVFLATVKNDTAQVKYWIGQGGGPSYRTSNDGVSSLSVAVHNQNVEVVKMLLDSGADVNETAGRDIYHTDITQLEMAIYYENPDIVQAFLDHGADITRKDKEGKNALDQAKDRYAKESVPEAKEKLKKIIDAITTKQSS
ncbi:hypothetical protein LJK88_09260 [Paenibacillus sp. P26]|nr:hypothetical protein LJK88_09260 [Paenibacillus sp. P26]UUZ89928.1 hypothetical protein LJK87_28330 [Paenibacillus sp. P25]